MHSENKDIFTIILVNGKIFPVTLFSRLIQVHQRQSTSSRNHHPQFQVIFDRPLVTEIPIRQSLVIRRLLLISLSWQKSFYDSPISQKCKIPLSYYCPTEISTITIIALDMSGGNSKTTILPPMFDSILDCVWDVHDLLTFFKRTSKRDGNSLEYFCIDDHNSRVTQRSK